MATTWTQATDILAIDSSVSGSDLYTSDTGATNGRELLDDTVSGIGTYTASLDSQPVPLDQKAVQLKIVCTARGLATCDISGTGANGESISETTINISSGTATTTKYFRTVDASGIDVDNLQDGDDFDIFQDRWGVVNKLINSSGDPDEFDFTPLVNIESGGTLSGTNISHRFSLASGISLKVKDGGTYQLGELSGNGHPQNGGSFIHDSATAKGITVDDGGMFKIYDSYTRVEKFSEFSAGSTIDMQRVLCDGPGRLVHSVTTDATLKDIYVSAISDKSSLAIYATPTTLENVRVFDNTAATAGLVVAFGATPTIRGLEIKNCTYSLRLYATGTKAYLVNPDIDNWTFVWQLGTGKMCYRQYEFNVAVQDLDGNPISGAVVTLKDIDDTVIINALSTQGDGKLASNTDVTYGTYEQADGDTVTLKTPHTLTISKDGYLTQESKVTIDEELSSFAVMLLTSVDSADRGLVIQEPTAKTGDTIDVGYRTGTGLTGTDRPYCDVYDDDDTQRVDTQYLDEIGSTGFYKTPVTLNTAWGTGFFLAVATHATYSKVGQFVRVRDVDVDDTYGKAKLSVLTN